MWVDSRGLLYKDYYDTVSFRHNPKMINGFTLWDIKLIAATKDVIKEASGADADNNE